jgi:hypothetical protein
MSRRVVLFRTLFLTMATACATVPNDHTAFVSELPKPILVKARSEIARMGYTITDEPTDTTRLEPGYAPIGGYVRGERLVGRDFDTGYLLYEVLSVTASPDKNQTRILVHGGMETGMPLTPHSPTSSSNEIRKRAAELLKKLQSGATGTQK